VGSTTSFDSLANFYAYVTQLCGYKAHKHEGKITGLAAHGEPVHQSILAQLIRFEQGRLRNASGRVFMGAVRELERRLPRGWRHEDLAASIQKHCEEVATAYIAHHLGGRRMNVAVAGGLFANVRINQKVGEIPGVAKLFVHPGMTDCGLAVGAALALCDAGAPGPRMPYSPEVIRDVYYGPGYSSQEVERALARSGLTYAPSASMAADVASLLARGHVVARFDGRMEYGPRALGNRSILYQPADPSVNDWLNSNLRRTEFMPFAPATLAEFAHECFHSLETTADSARFMTVTYDCTPAMKRDCPGVVHIDGTARPQLVDASVSPGYHAIIDEFRRLTGLPTVINTSFNMHEEPIVCTPDDAIRSFRAGHLDYLAIGDFIVPSPEPVRRSLRPVHAVALSR
jgi:carbamoyltransferase